MYQLDSAYAWEVVVLLRRTSLVVLDVALARYDNWRPASFVLLHVAILLGHLLIKPFSVGAENNIETLSLLGLIVIA